MAKNTNAKVYTQEKMYLITNPRFPDEPYMEHKPDDNDFARYQGILIKDTASVPSHAVISSYIRRYGTDYRSEVRPHPIEALQNRSLDNTHIARVQPVRV
jgi:hypothetical protein